MQEGAHGMPKTSRKRRGRGEGAIFQRADGLWVARLHRRTVYAKTKREAIEKLLQLQQDVLQGLPLKPAKITVAQHLEAFLQEKARSKQPNTVSKYRNHARNHIIPAIGHIKLVDLDYRHINAFFQLLEAKTDKHGRPKLSATTRTDIARVLSMALNDAVKKGLIRANPVHKVEGPRYEEKEARYMTPEEWERFLEAARGERLEELYILGFHTGLRPSELLGLPWENVDLENRRIRVAQALHEDGGRIWIGALKSDSSYRTIALGEEAVAALRRRRVRQLQDKLKAGERWAPPSVDKPYSSNLVFTTETGGWLRRSTIYKHDLARVRRKSGLHDVGLHTLRHTHAAVLIHMGASALQVKERLGHKDVAFTLNEYGHLFPKDDEKAAALMDAFAAARRNGRR